MADNLPNFKEHVPGGPIDTGIHDYNVATFKSWLEAGNIRNVHLKTNTTRYPVSVSRSQVGTLGGGGGIETIHVWQGQFPVDMRMEQIQCWIGAFGGTAGTANVRLQAFFASTWYVLETMPVAAAASFEFSVIGLDLPADTKIKLDIQNSAVDANYQDVSVNLILSQLLQEP